jgi:beta-glucosidase
VVVGANAEVRHCQGGNSSAVKALYEVTPLEGLRNRLGKGVQLDYFPGYPAEGGDGLPIAGEYLGIADAGAGTRGWRGRYFNNREAVGAPALVRADADLDFDWRGSAPTPGGRPMEYQVSWESTLTPPQSGTYEFQLEGAEHACFNLAGQPLVWRWECGGPDVVSKSIELEGGRAYDVSVWLKPNHDQVRLRLRWFPPWQPRRAAGRRADEAVEAARGADAVVFCGGLDHQYDVEGCDRRSLALPDGQDELIARLAAANPRTVVALVGGSPMAMPWLERVPAVVLLWYAGMEAGNALADVLLGRANPSGKLPFTFPRRLEDSPAHALDDYQFARCDYKEGVFVGYRWFDARGLEPLFPFGHGLSYTTFELSDPQVATRGKGRAWRAEVACTLRNTGAVTGAEVVQLYVEDREASLPRPPRELKGFEKVLLDPGETRRLTFRLTPDDLAFYDPAAGRWVAEPGAFTANLGTSSRRLPLQAPFTFPG